MILRSKPGLVQVCVALVCALIAAFSGTTQTRFAANGHHHVRHTRGNQHRGARSAGRSILGDLALEAELAHDPDRHPVYADDVVPPVEPSTLDPGWVMLELVTIGPFTQPGQRDVRMHPSRGPPSQA